MLIFSLPTKATTKELRITLSLFVVVVCHVCLTIPQVSKIFEHEFVFVILAFYFTDFLLDLLAQFSVLFKNVFYIII